MMMMMMMILYLASETGYLLHSINAQPHPSLSNSPFFRHFYFVRNSSSFTFSLQAYLRT